MEHLLNTLLEPVITIRDHWFFFTVWAFVLAFFAVGAFSKCDNDPTSTK